jgi:hypothetical protein
MLEGSRWLSAAGAIPPECGERNMGVRARRHCIRRRIEIMRRIALVIALVALASNVAAQRHAAYGEIGGSGVVPTANYERRFSPNWAGHIGLGFVAVSSSGDTDITLAIPLVGSYITHPEANHHFEAGGGLLFVFGDAQDLDPGFEDDEEEISNLALTGLAGYRYQKPGRGFIFRAAFSPVIYDGGVQPWAGFSFGYGW